MLHPIHDRVLACITAPTPSLADFEALALEVFAHQFTHIAAYRRVCEERGVRPEHMTTWRDIPPVPAQAFKYTDLCCGTPAHTFLTTGTTHGPTQRGRHQLTELQVYRAAAVRGMKEFLFPDVERMRVLSLIPAHTEKPESSLAQMVHWGMETFAADGSGYFCAAQQFDHPGLVAALRQSERDGQPVCLMTTTSAWVHFADWCRSEGLAFRLPHSSRIMDTGGSKGMTRPVSRKGLLQMMWQLLAIPGYFVANEYGMTELSSQWYDNVIRDRNAGSGTHRAKQGPHWVRTRVLDPVRLQEVAAGEPGLLCHVDLANVSSAVAVLTEDVGRQVADGFEVIGRATGAEARGCSLALDEFLSR